MTPNGLAEFVSEFHLAQRELRGVVWSHLEWSCSRFRFSWSHIGGFIQNKKVCGVGVI